MMRASINHVRPAMSRCKKAALPIALSVGLALTNADAAPRWMSDSEIVAIFQGVTLDGRYASGRPFTETYLESGRVEYLESGAIVGGYWSVTAGTLCTIYEIDPTGGCFRVARVAANCFEFYFASRTEAAAPGQNDASLAWTARGSLRGEAAKCPEGADV
jgi:hypothetical protein